MSVLPLIERAASPRRMSLTLITGALLRQGFLPVLQHRCFVALPGSRVGQWCRLMVTGASKVMLDECAQVLDLLDLRLFA
jgi:hypothetical protein